jgi:hypothetical protein
MGESKKFRRKDAELMACFNSSSSKRDGRRFPVDEVVPVFN